MKKMVKKMKGKKVLSIVLAAIMIATTFNIALPMLKLGANAATTIDGVTQERVVGTDGSYATTYDNYAAAYLNGASSPTSIVIPGLNAAQDYVIQGMTYYPKRDWMLVTAYHNVDTDAGETTQSSKVFALDAATGEFVAMFSFLNTDGSVNTDHGGGIAVSEHNIYYSCGDKDRKIAYAPLSALENAPLGQHTQIQLVDSIDFVEVGSISSDSKTAYTAYVCYDEGVLWMGNFYDLGAKLLGVTIAAADYNAPSNNTYNSMVFGYRLAGNSSAEEWDHLKGKFRNLLNVATASGTGSSNGSTFTWNAYQNGNEVSINGNITAPTATVGEFVGNNFASFTLTEGVKYTIEFTSTNINTDMYMFSPVGTHTNVKQSSQTTITQLEDGRYHYSMDFVAGLKPTGADSAWPTTQSTDGSYTGAYTLRFDQDYISAGETREFAITDIKVSQTNTYANAESVHDEGCAGSPSYALGLNNALKDVQYATVDNGKLYLSRSYGSGAGNSINFGFGDSSYLTIADIDLSVPGDTPVTISTKSTGSLDKTIMAHDISNYSDYAMMPMSEGLCVIEDNIFITFEGASNKYKNESSGLTSIGNCEKPVDVIWQLDPYELMETTVVEPEKSIYYEKVQSLADIKNGEEYIIVYESQRKDPVTQKNYLYALNADGNFKDYKLSKSTIDSINGYNGMIGHPISYYSYEEIDDGKEILYLEKPEIDDVESIRWNITKQDDGSYRFKNTETYFADCNYLFFNNEKISMMPGNETYLSSLKLSQLVDSSGYFVLSNGDFYLWCNDGTNANYNSKINSYYINNSGKTPIYGGISEQNGTFHCDALNASLNNIISGSIDKGETVTDMNHRFKEGAFNIYHRVVDEVASTYESRVYTDLDAELQEDGTYEVTLETYAISPNHYQYKGDRPTDYIIVADTSSSMAEKGSTGINEYNGSLSVASMSLEANTSDDNGTGVSGYGFSNPDEDIYFKHTDGKYYKAYMAVNTTELKKILGIISSMRQKYYVYYIADDGLYYCVEDHAVNPTGRTYTEWKAWVDSGENESDYSTKTSNSNRRSEDVYVGYHYRFDNINANYTTEHVRLDTLKKATNNLIGQIAAQNSANRIALVKYGADASSGFINTSGSLSTTDYANAFWATGTADQLKIQVNALTTSAQTNNNGLEMDYVNALISNSGQNYKADGTRNVAVIFLTDGIPGADANSATTAAANAVIEKALTAKNNGAFIYSVLIGNNDVSGFNKKGYMDGVSSRYAAAESLTSLGGMSVDGINYSISLATSTMNNFVNFGEMTVTEVENNAAVGLDNLDANSYLREQLNDAFKFPEDGKYSVKVDLVTGEFDEIGRFTFKDSEEEIAANADDAAKIVCDTDVASKTITVTNYHYAEEYIAKNRQTDGRKLRVTISGLLADEKATIQNTSINNTETTGIFKTKDNMDDNDAFKYLPTSYFNIPEYTYVLDYGIQMYDDDVNGTLKSVSADLSAQRDANGNLAYKTKSSNGLVEITNNNLDLLYSANPARPEDSGYCLIQRDDGTYDWFEIKVVPASNVLYEETAIDIASTAENVATDADVPAYKWGGVGTPTTTSQDLSTEKDVYGYDSNYANSTGFSNGTHYFAKVDTNNKRSDTATFTFKGTSFDLISTCGKNTGIQVVQIDKKVYIVDTFCDDATLLDSNNLIYQVPIVNWTGDYGEHTVKVTAAYFSYANGAKTSVKNSKIDTGLEMSSAKFAKPQDAVAMLESVGITGVSAEDVELIWFDDNSVLNGGTGVASQKKGSRAYTENGVVTLKNYIDGIRVYNPLQDTSDYIESERGAVYFNVIDELAKTENGALTGTLDSKVAFVTGTLTDLSFANYESVGPEGEFYLKASSSDTAALTFNVPAATPGGRVMVSLRAVNGVDTTAKINGKVFPINSATEMYYDITDLASTGAVVIENTGSGILSVNNIKLTNPGATPDLIMLDEGDLEAVQYYASMEPVQATVKNGVVTPVVEEEEIPGGDITPDVPEDDNTSDEKEEFSFMSLIEMLLSFIEDILRNAFGLSSLN